MWDCWLPVWEPRKHGGDPNLQDEPLSEEMSRTRTGRGSECTSNLRGHREEHITSAVSIHEGRVFTVRNSAVSSEPSKKRRRTKSKPTDETIFCGSLLIAAAVCFQQSADYCSDLPPSVRVPGRTIIPHRPHLLRQAAKTGLPDGRRQTRRPVGVERKKKKNGKKVQDSSNINGNPRNHRRRQALK